MIMGNSDIGLCGQGIKGDIMNKKIIWIMVIIVIGTVSVVAYKVIDQWQYRHGFQNVNLNQISCRDFDMSKRETPFWICVTTQDQLYSIEKNYNFELPDVEFKKEMLILSFGSELESLKFNSRESSYKTRKKYIGFPYFAQESSINTVYIYKTEKVPLMDTDEAGFPPNYRGKY